MKKDKRGRRLSDAKTADTAADESVGNADDPAAAEAPSDGPAAPAPKKSLPAFGFAADLLRKSDAAKPLETTGGELSGDASETTDSVVPDLDLVDVGQSFDPSAPTRIFDFADQITDRGRRQQEEAAPIQLDTFVTFSLAGETFAMPVHPIRQVFRVSTITRVPHAPRPIRGVTNLRGRVIPLIDLRLRVGLPETELHRSSRVISVSSRGRLVGLLVDEVHQVVHLDVLRVQPPPDDVMTIQSDYIQGVYGEGEDLILLLDIDRALIIREAGVA